MAPEPDDGPRLAARALRILILEDLPLVQEVMGQLLHAPGKFEICAFCATEKEGLAQYAALAPDVVLIDLKLKEGTGIGFLQKISSALEGAPPPLFIVVTNHAMPAVEAACRKTGAHHFFDKSRDLPRLRQTLDDWYNALDPGCH